MEVERMHVSAGQQVIQAALKNIVSGAGIGYFTVIEQSDDIELSGARVVFFMVRPRG